ncbi:MAG: MFS transporter [Elusimicrobia bacterium]|nr:MFS transporter [Elusimicrobiota bacterium]
MKRFTAVLAAAVLLWTSGPIPALAQTVSAGTGKVMPVPVGQIPGAGAAAGVSAVPGGGLAPLARTVLPLSSSLPGLGLPGIRQPGVEFPPEAVAAPARSAPLPAALPSQAVSVSPAIPAVEAAAPRVAPEAAIPAVPGGVTLPAEAPAEKNGPSSVEVLRDLGKSVAKPGLEGARLNDAFDGNAAVEVEPVEPSWSGETHPQRTARLSPADSGPVAAGPKAQAPSPVPDKPQGKLPFSYYLYLAGQFLYALGQEATSLIAPLYAYAAQGLAFAVTTQAAFLVAILPGSLLGSRWVKRFDAKKVYVAGNLLHGLAALSVPVAHVLTGAFSPVHFLVSNLVAGFIYGALRGVAEKEVAPRIVGQENRDRLNKAGALFYAAFEGAELAAALVIGALIPLLGLNPAAAIMSGMMLLSALPLALMKLKREGSAGGEEEKGGTEQKLPKMLYLPYIFTVFSHLSLYMFLAPFTALEVFKSQALNGTIVAFYTVGSLAAALVTAYLPKAAKVFDERGWAAVGIGTMVAFLAASLLFQSVPLTLGAAFLLGVGLTEMQIQWRSVYQQRLAIEAQPRVFQWLSIVPVVATLPPFLFMQAGLFMGWSMPALLGLIAAAIAAVSLGIPLFAWLSKRLGKKKA